MTTDFRALCAEVLTLLDLYDEGQRVDWDPWRARARAALAEPEPEEPTDDELMEAFDGEFAEFFDSSDGFGTTAIPRSEWIKVARAVLARWGQSDGPAVPDGREPASAATQPSDEDLNELMDSILFKGSPNNWGRQVARAVLARWGHQPAPPADVDVAELVAWLLDKAIQAADASQPTAAGMLTWAAQLIGEHAELRGAQPVPVSERLPGPEDCDDQGRCWWGEPQIEDSHDATWNLCTQDDAQEFLTWGTKCGWLPAHALPVPGKVTS